MMMTPDFGSDGVEDDGSEMTVWGVEYRHAMKRLAEAKAHEDRTRQAADLSAAFREVSLTADARAATVAESDTNKMAGHFWNVVHRSDAA